MREYNHKKVEGKWQKEWTASKLYKTDEDPKKEKCYVLDMFPYPSGDGLHVGHPKGYIATDVYSRMKRMQGFAVLHPMGWDAFGLPAEQYALKNKVHPKIAVEKNVARFKEQLGNLGFNYDWEREVNTTDPEFYKWTQWIFKQLFKDGLAHESHEPINWCPSCKTGLSNEDLDGDVCERCGTKVEQKPLRQWVLAITKYADRLLSGLDGLNWPSSITESQRNWIGRSEGAQIDFSIQGRKEKISVFTTRPDTLFGATCLVLSPEHALVDTLSNSITNMDDVRAYQKIAKEKSEIDRTGEGKEKTGVKLEGVIAINPANKEPIPIFVADYILAHVGTGAIMAVPAHDERDFQFAKKFSLSITYVNRPRTHTTSTLNTIGTGEYESPSEHLDKIIAGEIEECLPSIDGLLINSGIFNGLSITEAKIAITKFVGGTPKVTYKLRDWVFARQRYWGEPFPIVFDNEHKPYVVADSELPVMLPEVKAYEPTGTGESPLANIREWVEVYGIINKDGEFESRKKTDKNAELFFRETNTMPQWAGSSWYYLRFIDPKNSSAFVDKQKDSKWSPVDFYVGGAEHATRHLIYARFWHKFLYDKGYLNYDEPFTRLQNVGLILASDGRKMSKRWGNVINPDDIVETYGADALRVYEMFMGPFGQAIAWSTENLMGARRFVERVWRLTDKITKDAEESKETRTLRHQTIRKISVDIEAFAFNTAIAQLMIFLNHLEKLDAVTVAAYCELLLLIAPFAPHITEELWSELGSTESIHDARWPEFNDAECLSDTVVLGIQVNGKLRDTIELSRDATPDFVEKTVLALPSIIKWLEGKKPKKVIYIPGKIVNIVI
jgi:leucyl-tRNA synthetase